MFLGHPGIPLQEALASVVPRGARSSACARRRSLDPRFRRRAAPRPRPHTRRLPKSRDALVPARRGCAVHRRRARDRQLAVGRVGRSSLDRRAQPRPDVDPVSTGCRTRDPCRLCRVAPRASRLPAPARSARRRGRGDRTDRDDQGSRTRPARAPRRRRRVQSSVEPRGPAGSDDGAHLATATSPPRRARSRPKMRPRGGADEPIRLAWPDVGAEEARAVAEVLESGYLTMGPKVAEFEAELARACDVPHAVAVSSGTAALHLAVLALGIGPGDEVIVPAYTFPATANVVALAGARPVLVDVDPATMNLDLALVAGAVTDAHARGARGPPVRPAARLGRARRNGPERRRAARGRRGSARRALARTGVRQSRRRSAASRSTRARSSRRAKAARSRRRTTRSPTPCAACAITGSSRAATSRSLRPARTTGSPTSSARSGSRSCAASTSCSPRATRIAGCLHGAPGGLVATPSADEGDVHGWQAYVVQLDRRDEALRALREQGIEAQIGTYALHRLAAYRDQGSFPGADAAYERALALPFHTRLTDDELDRVADALRAVFLTRRSYAATVASVTAAQREPLAHPLAARFAERRRSSRSPSSRSSAARSAATSPRRTWMPGLAVGDEVEQPADRARDDGSRVRHRLGADDAEALAVRRHRDDGRATVEPKQLVVRDEPARARHAARATARRRRSRAGSRSPPRRARARLSPATGGRRRARTAARPRRRRRPATSTPLGITTTARAPSARASVGERRSRAPRRPRRDAAPRARATARVARARRRSPRPARPPACASAAPTAAEGSQCAWTRSAPRAARAAATANESRKSGSSRASQGRRRRFPTIPEPYASPKCGKSAGDTTSTSSPRPRSRSTASAMKRPATSPGSRGYDVVRTTTRMGRHSARLPSVSLMATAVAPLQGRDGGPLRRAGGVLRPVRERGVPLEAPEQHVPPPDRPADALPRPGGRPRARDRLGLGRPARGAEAERRRRRRRLAGDGRPRPGGAPGAPVRARRRRAARSSARRSTTSSSPT